MHFVDDQERLEDDASSVRWLDRIAPGGTWSGNVVDFYRRVVNKLMVDVNVPAGFFFAIRVRCGCPPSRRCKVI